MSKKSYKLSQLTIEKLGYYVYLLIDPRTNKPFYVGKGVGNRINHHLLGALDERTKETDKIKRIKEIQSSNLDVKLVILRHGLTEKEAYEVESALIGFIEKVNLTNIVSGHNSEDRGIMTLDDIKIKYESEEAVLEDPMILININRLYDKKMSSKDLYDATRKSWIINIKRAEKIKLACSVFRGIIREVYIIKKWMPSNEVKGRLMFEGEIAPDIIRNKYIHKSVLGFWKQGSQNPIKYFNK